MNIFLVIRPVFFQNCLIILRFSIQNAHRLNLIGLTTSNNFDILLFRMYLHLF